MGDEGAVFLLLGGSHAFLPVIDRDSQTAHVDPGSSHHNRPVLGRHVDGRTVIKDGLLFGGELTLGVEALPFDAGEFPGVQTPILVGSQGLAPVAQSGTGGQEGDEGEEEDGQILF